MISGEPTLTPHDAPPPTANPFLARVAERAQARPDQVFCHFVADGVERPILWGALMDRARVFARVFAEHDQGRGGVVLMFLRHTPDMHPAYLGAMLAGCVPSFMPCTSPRQDPALYWKSHQVLLERIAPACIVAAPDEQAEMREAGLDLGLAVLIDPASVAGEPLADAPLPPLDAVALLQHSSGTTGLKKGVKLSYRAIQAQIDSYADVLALNDDDVIVSWLPLYHDMGLIACWVLPLYTGTPFVHLDPFEWLGRPEALFAAIERHRGTLAWLPNFAFEHLARMCPETAHDLSSMRAFIDCSEPCRETTLERFAATFADVGVTRNQLQCCYAMAETVFAVSQTAMGGVEPTVWIDVSDPTLGSPVIEAAPDCAGALPIASVGRPIPGAEVSIRDAEDRPLAEGFIGEVAVRGDFLFDGYNEEPERTAERVRNGWYRTRDSGFLIDGRLYLLGRLDDVIIVNGKNVYAHDVEAVVSRIAGVKPGRAVAVGQTDAAVGSQALVVIAEGTDPATGPAARREIMQAVFALIGVKPGDVRIVEPDWIVKTTSGKISREQNALKYARVFARGGGSGDV